MRDPRPGRRLHRQMRDTCERFALLAPGDRVMVALSGGKDSYTMLTLLDRLVRGLTFEVELVAVHLDQGQPGYDGAPLVSWLERWGGRWEILGEDTYAVVTDKLAEGATYCSLCSRLRRGILYEAATRLGCTKIALGHHRDDALETFLMNLFFSGRLQAMPPRYRTNCGRFEVIRPMIECEEARIAAFAEAEAFPILPCNLCGSQPGLQRDAMAALLRDLEARYPNVRGVMASALGNVRASHLLDADLARVWASRDPEVRPDPAPIERPAHARALPVLRSDEA
ncbi:MAG TPA: tRNA 2-thiocytidine(32) synthetase TtcA [Sandaracinaceae bacterium LLY-WYZ-13_1]|nr:tRNA 2-thiocytidine(32) synthetase TtcA [Sandaracinaceae bacterium LLY-WYZ-13_1]